MITLEISFGAFVGLGVFAGIVVLGVAGGLTIRNKLRNVSRQLFDCGWFEQAGGYCG